MHRTDLAPRSGGWSLESAHRDHGAIARPSLLRLVFCCGLPRVTSCTALSAAAALIVALAFGACNGSSSGAQAGRSLDNPGSSSTGADGSPFLEDSASTDDAGLPADASTEAPPEDSGSGASVAPADGGCPSGVSLPVGATSGCRAGSVDFQLSAPSSWTYGGSADNSGPNVNWLTVHCPSGSLVYRSPAEDTPLTDCRACESEGWSVAIGSFSGTIPDAGLRETWDGMFFAFGTCPGSTTACAIPACAAPGSYEAEFCACPSSDWQSCSGGTGLVCATVPFVYPSAVTVSAMLDSSGDP